jgi:hypothetical protein
MSDIEYYGKPSSERRTSLEEDHKAEQAKIRADHARFKKYGTNNQALADLMAKGQVLPAADLVRIRDEQVIAAKQFAASITDEVNNQKSKRQHSIAPVKPIFSREPFED